MMHKDKFSLSRLRHCLTHFQPKTGQLLQLPAWLIYICRLSTQLDISGKVSWNKRENDGPECMRTIYQ